MKLITIAVIIAGATSFWGTYTPPAIPSESLAITHEYLIDQPPLNTEPDDEEDHDRVKQPRRKTK